MVANSAKLATKNDAYLAVLPGFRQVLIESPLNLDDCSPPIGQLAHLPIGDPFPPDPGTSINGCMRCSDLTV
ncbi:hypothetical protein TNCV_2497971 [Trichonephila clavipes]|nr:hypothetical protein TNCV_2497971 [Trichonephila clavipes]